MTRPATGATAPGAVTITPLHGIPEVGRGDDLARLLLAAVDRAGLRLREGDILAVSSKIVSKAMGLTASPADKEAVVAAETVRVVAERVGASGMTRIVQGKAGPVMAAAGVDASNTGGRELLLLLPHDPDAVCRSLHTAVRDSTGVREFAVVLTDTSGRPWREGQIDFALGSYGLRVLDDLRGSHDADGRPLEVTARAVADEIAAAADLVKGKTAGVPAALVRGLAGSVLPGVDPAGPTPSGLRPRATMGEETEGASRLVRVGDGDWFALGSQEAVRAALGVPPGPAPGSVHGPRPVVGDTTARRVLRSVEVAFRPHVDPWHRGVTSCGLVTTGDAVPPRVLVVTGTSAFGVGVVCARLQVALHGEGVAFDVDPEPTLDAAGSWQVTLTIRDDAG